MFELITLLLSVIAIVFASVQYHDARNELDRLQNITSSIQTQYVGEFPANLEAITDVINHAVDQGELDIMTDFAGYAIYSDNDKYQKYLNALIAAHNQRAVQIKMMVYDQELGEKAFQIQFKPHDFNVEKDKGFHGFFKNHPPEPKDYNDFMTRILYLQNDAANDMCSNGIEVRRVPSSQEYRFFLWQTNKPEAVFAFRNVEERNKEISFHSLDPELINIFNTIFNETWNDVDPKTHPELAKGEDPACQYIAK